MKIRCLPLGLLLFLFSCDSSDQIENRSSQPLEADSVLSPLQGPDDANGKPVKPVYLSRFAKAFFDFQEAVYNEDAEGVNNFIDPGIGLYIIENPGALPKMTLVRDIRDFKRDFKEESFFTIKDRLQSCQLKEESLPAFTCGTETKLSGGYSKEGCFAADDQEFQKNEVYKYASLPDPEVKNIERTLPLVKKTVVQTASSYRFHFGYINGQWKVLFIDLRVPCSA
jgi:hypothetical protein